MSAVPEHNHVALGPTGLGVGDGFVDLVERPATRDQFIQLEPPLFVKIDHQRDVTLDHHVAHFGALHALAEALLEYETLEGKHVHEILEHGKIITPVVTAAPEEPEEQEVDEASSSGDAEPEKGDDVNPGGEPAGMPA